MNEELDSLRKENLELRTELADLVKENLELRAQLAAQRNALTQLTYTKTNFETVVDDLRKMVDQLQDDKEVIKIALAAALNLAQGYIESEYPEVMWPERMAAINKLRAKFNIPKDQPWP